MKKKIGIAVLVAAAVLAVALFLVFRGADKPAQANADEISLQIQLDLKEDIGLLLIDSDMDGAVSSGGSSNADKTMLKKGDCIYWPIERQNDENIPDNVTLSLRFTVITEYCEPNYENIRNSCAEERLLLCRSQLSGRSRKTPSKMGIDRIAPKRQ